MIVAFAGIMIVSVVLLDVFLTVLDADGRSIMSGRLYRAFWWLWRHFARLLPKGTEDVTLSLGAPLMIPLAIAVWILGLVTGFALLYFGGFSPDEVVTGGGSQPSLSNAFKLSWVTLSTIGFVEISPSNMPYSMAVALEAILGGIVLTLTITYYLNVHHVVRTYNEFVSFIEHHTEDVERPFASLGSTLDGGTFTGETFVARLHDEVSALHEGLRRYPIVYYFRTVRADRGLPKTLARLRKIAGGLSFTMPAHPSLSRSMAVRALRRALVDLAADLQARYVPVNTRTTARTAAPAVFVAVARGRSLSPDVWVERFLQEVDVARAAADIEHVGTLAQLYDAYTAWLPFTLSLGDFEAAIANDLGYSQRLRPGRSSSLVSILAQGPRDGPQPLLRSVRR